MPDYFGEISFKRAIFKKYMKERCPPELYLQLSLKYFANTCQGYLQA